MRQRNATAAEGETDADGEQSEACAKRRRALNQRPGYPIGMVIWMGRSQAHAHSVPAAHYRLRLVASIAAEPVPDRMLPHSSRSDCMSSRTGTISWTR